MIAGDAILAASMGAAAWIVCEVLKRVINKRRAPEDIGRWLDRVGSRAHALTDARLEVAWQEYELHKDVEDMPQIFEDQVHLVVQLGQRITDNSVRLCLERGLKVETQKTSFVMPQWPFKESPAEVVEEVPPPPRLPQVGSPSMPPSVPGPAMIFVNGKLVPRRR